MAKNLVAYFSASGRTRRMAERLASGIDADLFEIVAAQPYTEADLDWQDKNSRTTRECDDEESRPQIAGLCENLADYDVIFLGMPIWWYKEAPIIRTFLEAHAWEGKTIIPFVTSGSSGYMNTSENVARFARGAKVVDGKRLRSAETESELTEWAKRLLAGL